MEKLIELSIALVIKFSWVIVAFAALGGLGPIAEETELAPAIYLIGVVFLYLINTLKGTN